MTYSTQQARWRFLWQRLRTVRLAPLPEKDEVDALLDALPRRLPDEPPSDWLARAKAPAKPADPSSSPTDEER
jgi:hypothetical protein